MTALFYGKYTESKNWPLHSTRGRISFNNTVESRFFNHLWKKQIGSNYLGGGGG